MEQFLAATVNLDARMKHLEAWADQAGDAINTLGALSKMEWNQKKRKWLKKKKSAITKPETSNG